MRRQFVILLPALAICIQLFLPSFLLNGKLVLSILVIISIYANLKELKPSIKQLFLTSLISVVGGVGTFVLANNLALGPVIASGLIGLAGARLLSEERQFQLYLGAFVGMTAAFHFTTIIPLIFASALGGIYWELLCESWQGVGGRLGTLAASAVLTLLLITGGSF